MSADIELIRRAGKIACEVRKKTKTIVKPGLSLLEIATEIENLIVNQGGVPAFPVNISINAEAAHYTPMSNDEKKIPEGSIVKIDLGVAIEGYLADTAITLSFNDEYEDLIKAVEEALEKAISYITPGVKTSVIGSVIEKTIKTYGYKPIRNLSGHTMSKYILHSGLSIPNVESEVFSPSLKPPLLLAIEPFATNGIGWVVNGDVKTIYSLARQLGRKEKKLEIEEVRFLSDVFSERNYLPFTERWYSNKYPLNFIRQTLLKAEKQKIVVSYPVLVESTYGMVSQAEDTVLLLDKEVIVTTREC